MPTKTAKRLPTAVPADRRGQGGTLPPPSTRAASAAASTELAKPACVPSCIPQVGRPQLGRQVGRKAKSPCPPSRETGLPGRPRVKTGRPLAKIDEARVAELAFNGLTNRRIGILLGVDDQTIANRFSTLLDKKRAERQLAILNRQWEILNGAAGPHGATTMAIWLGKNELGQTDKRDVAVSGGLTVKVSITADKPEETPRSAEDDTIIDVAEVRPADLPPPAAGRPAGTSLQAGRLLEGPHDGAEGP